MITTTSRSEVVVAPQQESALYGVHPRFGCFKSGECCCRSLSKHVTENAGTVSRVWNNGGAKDRPSIVSPTNEKLRLSSKLVTFTLRDEKQRLQQEGTLLLPYYCIRAFRGRLQFAPSQTTTHGSWEKEI